MSNVAGPTRSAARLAAILDHLPDALLLVDGTGAVVNANARAVDVFEVPDTQLVGTRLLDLLPGFGQGRRRRPAQGGRRPRPDGPIVERFTARRLDGSELPIELTSTVLSWGDGDELLLLLVRLRRGGEDAGTPSPQPAQGQLTAVLHATTDAICGVDADGRVVLANPAVATLLGHRTTEVAGRDLHELVLHRRADGSPYPREQSPVYGALRAGRTTLRRPEIAWRADGTAVPVHVSAVPIRAGEEVVGAVAALAEIAAPGPDQQGHALRGPLAGDLRRGLAAMRDSLQRVLAGAGGTLSREAREALARAAARAEQMLNTVAEAADRDEAAETDKPRVARVEIGQLVERAVATTSAAAAQAGVAVAVLPEALPVDVDAECVVAALKALLEGAVKSSPRGSTVAISANRRGDRVRVVVRDARPTTRGAAERESRPTFDPLTPSPGIDVPFVQTMAERHGGRFSIEAAPGGGTAYAVELPIAVDEDEEARQDPAVAPADRREPQFGWTMPTPVDQRQASEPTPDAEPALTRDVAAASTLASEPALAPVVASPARPRALPAPFDFPEVPEPSTQEVLVWPHVHEATTQALSKRGWKSVTVRMPQDVAERRQHAAALLVDPLTGPVSRASLTRVRAAAASVGLPLLVAAGLGEVSSDAVHASDPAALIGALRLPGASASLVLLVEPDPVLAEAMGATLERRGMRALLSLSESEARLRAALAPPDLVLLDLGVMPSPRPGILDWLRSQGRLAKTPVVAYTAAGLPPDHETRLRHGKTVLFVQARPEGKDVDERLAELVLQLAGTPEPL